MDIKTNGHLSDEITLTEDDLKQLSDGKELKGSGVVVKKEEPEVYSIGDRFKNKASGKKFILASVADYKVDLIRLETGTRQTCAFTVIKCNKISKEIMTSVLCSFTRYYDARKQCKC